MPSLDWQVSCMITRQQALELFAGDDLIALGMAADETRKRLHPEGLVSYSMEQGIQDAVLTLTFAAQEPMEQIVSRLDAVRQSQIDGRGLLAVMPRSNGTAVEHLKIVALTRIYLDNVPHVQASWQGGLKIGQVALRFGANDLNGTEAGTLHASEEDLRRVIRGAGFTPKQRDPLFQTYCLN